ncbi:NAD(P)-dependent alcohol dehydrogenase [Phenylobacterium sp.]|uniref:zinc-dependent alcohol dehydrogenase family protein n=1 Tax=Phenylobacterium sp. TaxID=1871053 RepID=UPI002E37ACD8|nr:NAD(P)-dependent alcohol dehydrogenase [Phenylobacterium sp.]HEX4708987.1 NAD(P)-dependent alcohol dehydrogenase [Phenylobacterium sp.]
MKRWSMDGVGRERLRMEDAAPPTPGPGDVLVRIGSVSLNYRDLLVISGQMGAGLAFPFSPGSDFAGEVIARGEGAQRFAVGDRVFAAYVPGWIDGRPLGSAAEPYGRSMGGPLPGVLAELVALPESWLVKAPGSLDDAQASTLPIAGVTAWYTLVEKGGLMAGQTVLVQGTGGVALFGVQIACAHGARVVVTSSDDAKLARAKALGADIGINRLQGDWARAVVDATDGHGADHILELAGGPNLAKSVEAAAVDGRIYVIGVIEGLDLSASVVPVLYKQVNLHGILVGPRRVAEDFVRAVDTLNLKPVIDRRYPFEALPEALAHLERGPFGKIVIDVIR